MPRSLFGHFDGPGLEAAGAGFEHLGLKPGKAFAALAGGSELVGGILTVAGGADPVGPLALAGAMTVASLTHAHNGPLMQKGGFELPASYLAAALALTGTGPGRSSLDRLVGFHLPKGLTRLTFLGAGALTGYSAAQVIKTKRANARAAGLQFPQPRPRRLRRRRLELRLRGTFLSRPASGVRRRRVGLMASAGMGRAR